MFPGTGWTGIKRVKRLQIDQPANESAGIRANLTRRHHA